MSWLDQIYDDKGLTTTARDIAFRISRFFNHKHYNNTGACIAWPAYNTLAEEAGCTAKTVQRAVSMLRDRGHLLTNGNGGRHRSLIYCAVPKQRDAGRARPDVDEQKGGHTSPPFTGDNAVTVKKEDNASPKGGHQKPENVDSNVLQTSLIKIPDQILESITNDVEQSPARAPTAIIALSILLHGPTVWPLPPVAPFLRGKEQDYPELVLDHQATYGWPDLLLMCKDTSRWNSELAKLALEMKPISVGTDLWTAWKAEYRSRGWPMPKPLDGIACFPPGGPAIFDTFLERIKDAMLSERQPAPYNVVRFAQGR